MHQVNIYELVQTLVIFGLVGSATPVPQKLHNETDYLTIRPCALLEYSATAYCDQNGQVLLCKAGFPSEWTRETSRKTSTAEHRPPPRISNINGPAPLASTGAQQPSLCRLSTFWEAVQHYCIEYDITHLKVVEWPGECFNVGRLQQHFPELTSLEFHNCTMLRTFKGHFGVSSKIERIKMRGLNSLWEVPGDLVFWMPRLVELDLRGNRLRHMKAKMLRPQRLERVFLSDNRWDCSDGGLDWLAMERDNSTIKKKIVDYKKLMCNQQLYRGKPLHIVMNIIRTVRQTCPAPCACAMTHVVSDSAGAIIPLITVDCAGRGLDAVPATLPPNTTTLRLDRNKINSIRSIVQNPQYQKLADLYLDNNSLTAVKELEGFEWFSTFRVLSLRGNKIKQIPVFAFDKAFQVNNNLMQVFLGNNPWRCDCHFVPRFQGLLLKYKKVIRDLRDIRCSKSDDKTISLVQISTMPLGNVCRSGAEMPISPINIVNITLTALILLVVGRFLYDWHTFKTTGKLPWLSSILP